jgi:uncharacterized membrane protein
MAFNTEVVIVTTEGVGVSGLPGHDPSDLPVRSSRGATALDHKSRATRSIIWMAFFAVVIWVLVFLSWLLAPKPIAPVSWSTPVGGRLQVAGRPNVFVQATGAQTAIVGVDAIGMSQQTYNIASNDLTKVRTFWRGTTLVVDTGTAVWRIDSKLKLLLRAPDAYGWPAD